MKPIYSLSGEEIKDVSDEDRILFAISDTEVKVMTSDINGRKMIGPVNAYAIRRSLLEAGFKIVREYQQIDKS